MPNNTIAVLLFYFGSLPEWMDLYVDSIKHNYDIDFYLFTDCNAEKYALKNFHIKKTSFSDYNKKINKKLGLKTKLSNSVKLCDFRPMLGIIHEEIVKEYTFYGWADLDLVFGKIRDFYTEDLLNKYDVLTTHNDRIAGHFSLFRSNSENLNKYKKIYKWKENLHESKFVGLDEHGITNAYTMTVFDKINEKFNLKINNFFTKWLSRRKVNKMYMVEQYTTPFIPKPWLDGTLNSEQPEEWLYFNKKISNTRDGNKNFIYLHFMNFKSSHWRADNTTAPWQNISKIYRVKKENLTEKIYINKKGIYTENA